MTTSEVPAPVSVLPGVTATGAPRGIDDATLDRITSNLLGPIPGAAAPESAGTAALTAARTTSPLASTSGLPGPTAGVSSAATPFPGAPIPAAPYLDEAIHQSQIPAPASIAAAAAQTAAPGAATSVAPSSAAIPASPYFDAGIHQSQIPAPSSVAAAAPATGITEAAAGPIDWSPPLPANVEIHDGSLPRLFDDAPLSGKPPQDGAPSYYFLTPILATRPEAAAPAAPFQRRLFDVNDIRRDFPILEERVHGKRLVWLDNAATTQKPQAVIDRLVHYYSHEYSNVHRAAHELAARSTDAYESAREKVQRFIGAGSAEEIVFVRGTTEAVNLVAASYGRKFLGEGDEIVLSTLEHHSNIVPWQFLAEQVGAVIRVVPVTDRGEVLLSDFERTLTTRTKFVSLTHVSNALGTILPVREMIDIAHRRGAKVLIDGAQAVSHFPVNVQSLDADFYAFSGHKLFGPSAIGVLYGKKALLDEMPPWQGGGNMIQRVTFEHSTFADPPSRFEAGTAALGPAVGLGAAVDYLERIGMQNVATHERALLAYATEALARIPGVRLIGTAPEKAGVVSFITDKIPAEEMGKILDQDGIAVRAGHHCAQPTMDRFGLEATVRPSLALYNTHDEIDQLERAVRRALQK
ncbi:MAG: cysteine desulfurase [Candidatus Binatus sp.]|uniref:SufS family cysteine desulfurase n=1 Tax=Candidatus Binatus sp. TaxID=2811406 RepID=UPI003C7644D1